MMNRPTLPLGLAVIALAVSACTSGSAHHAAGAAQNSPPPAGVDVTPSAAPTLTPKTVADVKTDETTFRLHIESVKTGHTYTDGYHQAQVAGSGNQLVIVVLNEKNVGMNPGNLEDGTSSPMTMNATDGKTFTTSTTWSDSSNVNPGLSQQDTYVFETPKGEKAATLTVTLATGGDDGTRPSAILEMPTA